MTNFVRERIDALWFRGLKVPHLSIRNIDEKTKNAVSGTGGTWAPTNPIFLGGEGLELQCPLILNNAVAQPATGKHFIFGDSDYFVHGTPPSRVIDISPLEACSSAGHMRMWRPWMDAPIAVVPQLRTVRAGARFRLPLRIPDNSILTQVDVDFRVGQAHANVPLNLSKARVIRLAADGTVSQYPLPTSTDYERDGWVSPALPGSGALWYAAAALQTLTLNFSSAGAVTNSALYGYALEWWEENGTDSFTDWLGNYLMHIRVTVTQPELSPY